MSPRAAVPPSPSSSPPDGASVLLVEDDQAIAKVVFTALSSRGYDVRVAYSGRAGLDAAALDEPDIVVLDLGLPDIDGIDVCRVLRRTTRNPIVVLSADGAEDRKVRALDEGATDYVTKPFSMPELLARMRVAVRYRHALAAVVDDSVLEVGDVLIDVGAREVSIADVPVDLTRTEFDLLLLFARNLGKVLTHRTILGQVWDDRERATTTSLRVHVLNLRRKLGSGPRRPEVVTEPGVGYRLALAELDA